MKPRDSIHFVSRRSHRDPWQVSSRWFGASLRRTDSRIRAATRLGALLGSVSILTLEMVARSGQRWPRFANPKLLAALTCVAFLLNACGGGGGENGWLFSMGRMVAFSPGATCAPKAATGMETETAMGTATAMETATAMGTATGTGMAMATETEMVTATEMGMATGMMTTTMTTIGTRSPVPPVRSPSQSSRLRRRSAVAGASATKERRATGSPIREAATRAPSRERERRTHSTTGATGQPRASRPCSMRTFATTWRTARLTRCTSKERHPAAIRSSAPPFGQEAFVLTTPIRMPWALRSAAMREFKPTSVRQRSMSN